MHGVNSLALAGIEEIEHMTALSADSWWQGLLAGIGVVGIVAIAAT